MTHSARMCKCGQTEVMPVIQNFLRAIAKVGHMNIHVSVLPDSIQATEAVTESSRIRSLPMAALIGEAIRRIADESSVSSLFD